MNATTTLWALAVFVLVVTAVRATWGWLAGGFKVRCPACDGTGLCELGGDEVAPHACCNPDCEGTLVPREWLPPHFWGAYRGRAFYTDHEHLLDHLPRSSHYAPVGRGFVWGSLAARLARGGPRRRLGYHEGDEHTLPLKTTATGLKCLYEGGEDV